MAFGTISGNLTEDARVYIIDESTGVLESDTNETAGTYEITTPTVGQKVVIARGPDGESKAYGNVTAAGSPILVVDSFDDQTLDTNIWATNIVPNASVTVDNELRLNNQTGSIHSGAHVYTVETWNRVGSYQITVKWKPHNDHYGSAHIPYIAFVNPSHSTNSYYGDPISNMVKLCLGSNGDGINRTQLRIEGLNETTLDSAAINITENIYHDIIFTYNK
jgi:hypothetical protein